MHQQRTIAALTLALVLATTSLYSCEGLVVVENTPLYEKEQGDKVTLDLRQGDIVMAAKSGMMAYWVKGLFGPSVGCELRKLKANERIRVKTIPTDPEDKVVEGWITYNDKVALFRFVNNAPPGCGACLDHPSAMKSAALTLDESVYKDFEPPRIANSSTYVAPLDKVWSATIETLSDNSIPIDVLSMESGLITTKAIMDPQSKTMACATTYYQKGMVSFSIFIKQSDGSTIVKITSTFVAERASKPIKCFSNGTLEKWLFSSIAKILQ